MEHHDELKENKLTHECRCSLFIFFCFIFFPYFPLAHYNAHLHLDEEIDVADLIVTLSNFYDDDRGRTLASTS